MRSSDESYSTAVEILAPTFDRCDWTCAVRAGSQVFQTGSSNDRDDAIDRAFHAARTFLPSYKKNRPPTLDVVGWLLEKFRDRVRELNGLCTPPDAWSLGQQLEWMALTNDVIPYLERMQTERWLVSVTLWDSEDLNEVAKKLSDRARGRNVVSRWSLQVEVGWWIKS